MHYTFDLISLLIFITSLFILWIQNWRLSKNHRAIYGLVILTGIYLIGVIYLAFSWHKNTGKEILETFYALDILYFVILSIALGFMTLYFADICIRKVKHPLLIFVIPLIVTIVFLFFNHKTGWMFSYDENGIYHRGPLLWTNYVIWIAYFAAMIYLVLYNRNKLGLKTTTGFLLFFAYEFGLQVYQFYMINFYIGGIAFSTGVIYLMIAPVFLEPGKDEITGLYNRRGFVNSVKEILHYDDLGEYCMVAVDINNFLNVNSRFGFQIGNQVLKYMSSYLKKLFPDTDAIARFNADHFFVFCHKDKLIYELPDIEISDVIDTNEKYTISIFEGIYPINDRNEDVLSMCDRAVFAVQQVKGDFNHQYAFFDELGQEKLQLKSYILQEMSNALKENKFIVYYQPIFDLKTGDVASCEALVHWIDEKYGLIKPSLFIPLFENNNSITTLDLFVCKEVCKYINNLKKRNIKHVPVSINISRVDILSNYFTKELVEIVESYGLTPEEIRLEITESAFVSIEEISDNINYLHDKGFKILMDDFGSAYSTFNTFARIPIDILKADLGFVYDLGKSERGKDVIESIVEMAKKISMPIVVEGVETTRQLEVLKQMEIDYVQGYIYSRPMPTTEFERLLNNDFKDNEYLGEVFNK